jgi:hypothetical protein
MARTISADLEEWESRFLFGFNQLANLAFARATIAAGAAGALHLFLSLGALLHQLADGAVGDAVAAAHDHSDIEYYFQNRDWQANSLNTIHKWLILSVFYGQSEGSR